MRSVSDVARVAPATAWSLLAIAANAAAGILVARALMPADRGLVAIAISAASLIGVFAALGTNVTLRAQLPRNPDVNVSGFLRLSCWLLCAIVVPLLAICGLVTSNLVDSRFSTPAILSGFIGFGVVSFVWFQGREALAALGRITFGAAINACGSFILLPCIALLHYFGVSSPSAVLGAYVASFAVQALVVLVSIREQLLEPGKGKRILLRDGPKMLGYHFGQDLVFQADRYAVGLFAGTGAAGLYAVAATPAELLRIPARTSGQFALLDAARGHIPKQHMWRSVGLWLALTVAPIPLLWAIAPWLIPFVFGSSYAPAVEPFRFLLLAQAALVPFLMLSRVLVGMGATWSASVSGLVGLLVLASSALVLMPEYGAVGAACAVGISYGAMSVVSILMVRRRLRAARQPSTSAST